MNIKQNGLNFVESFLLILTDKNIFQVKFDLRLKSFRLLINRDFFVPLDDQFLFVHKIQIQKIVKLDLSNLTDFFKNLQTKLSLQLKEILLFHVLILFTQVFEEPL